MKKDKIIVSQNNSVTTNRLLAIGNTTKELEDCIIKPNILECNSNYVVLDYGGRILSSVGTFLTTHGYNIKILDLINFAHNTYNPFAYIQNSKLHADIIINCIMNAVNVMFPTKAIKSNMKLLLDAVFMHVYLNLGSTGTLKQVYRLIQILDSKNDPGELISDTNIDEVIRSAYMLFFEKAGKNTKKTISLCEEALRVLDNDDIIFTTASNSIHLEKFNEEKYALFILLPEKDRSKDIFSSLILSQFYSLFLKSKRPIKVFLNEFGPSNFSSTIFQYLKYSNATNISTIITTTDASQLKSCVFREKNITNLFDDVLYTRSDDEDAIKFVLKKTGNPIEYPADKKKTCVYVHEATCVVDSRYDLKQHPAYRDTFNNFEEFEKNKREYKGLMIKEILLQYALRVDMDPERIMKVAEYSGFNYGEEKRKITEDAYNIAKSLYLNRDFNTLVSYIVKVCDCAEELTGSKSLLRPDGDGFVDENTTHNWYRYLINYLEKKIYIIDASCNLHPEVMQYLLYFLTLDKNPTFCNMYNYFYSEDDNDACYESFDDGDVEFETDDESDVDEQGRPLAAAEITSIETSDENCDETGFNEEKVKECLAELDGLIGLEEEKDVIHEIVNIIMGNRLRVACGNAPFPISSYHIAFTGNPGTGKTTVARLYAKILHYCGILNKGSLLEVGRVDLVGGYLGQTALKTKKAIDKATGGVLFIDEAYALMNKLDDAYGLECISTLVQSMENMKDKLAIILAGYTKEMNEFLKTNPGLRSRVYNVVEFKDYTTDELLLIFDKMCEEKGFVISEKIREKIKEKIVNGHKNKDFGNARGVRNCVDIMTKAILTRTVKENLIGKAQNVITKADIEKIKITDSDKKKLIGFV